MCRSSRARPRTRSPRPRSRPYVVCDLASRPAGSGGHGISQSAARPGRAVALLEFLPQIGFWLASLVRDRRWVLNNRTVRKIGPRSNVIDAIEQYWPLRAEQDFIIIGVELARREPAASRESAKRIRQPIR